MRKYFIVAAALALGACAEFEAEAPSTEGVAPTAETVTMGRSVVVETEDGATFEVTVVHDGSLTTIEEVDLLDSIEVIGITPVDDADITPVSADSAFVPPVNPVLVPDEAHPVNIYVTGIDGDLVVGDYRWDWIDEIDAEDIEAWIEDICPPWH